MAPNFVDLATLTFPIINFVYPPPAKKKLHKIRFKFLLSITVVKRESGKKKGLGWGGGGVGKQGVLWPRDGHEFDSEPKIRLLFFISNSYLEYCSGGKVFIGRTIGRVSRRYFTGIQLRIFDKKANFVLLTCQKTS